MYPSGLHCDHHRQRWRLQRGSFPRLARQASKKAMASRVCQAQRQATERGRRADRIKHKVRICSESDGVGLCVCVRVRSTGPESAQNLSPLGQIMTYGTRRPHAPRSAGLERYKGLRWIFASKIIRLVGPIGSDQARRRKLRHRRVLCSAVLADGPTAGL